MNVIASIFLKPSTFGFRNYEPIVSNVVFCYHIIGNRINWPAWDNFMNCSSYITATICFLHFQSFLYHFWWILNGEDTARCAKKITFMLLLWFMNQNKIHQRTKPVHVVLESFSSHLSFQVWLAYIQYMVPHLFIKLWSFRSHMISVGVCAVLFLR